jgi:hypothetical protein
MKTFFAPFLLIILSLLCFSFRDIGHFSSQNQPGKNLKAPLSDSYAILDDYAKKAPWSSAKNIDMLAAYLLKAGPKNDQEKSRLVFSWIATHIRYDLAAYYSEKIMDCSAETVLAKKSTICEGYANLFKKLGEAMGLEVVFIVGYSRGPGFKEGTHLKKANHAWNAVKIDGQWQLSDPTWGGGSLAAASNSYIAKLDPYWFNTNPEEFIFYHLPKEEQWQLIDAPITLKQFENMPVTAPDFFQFGLSNDSIFKGVMNGSFRKLPESFGAKFPVTVLEAPYNGLLKRGQKYKFVIQCKGPEMIELIDGDKFFDFTRDGDRFYIEHEPKSNVLRISYKLKVKDTEAQSILKYQVK